ncbi:MAG: GNAT family N-acetyltransferase [Rhizobium sp.]|nr:GNAT family N-acetyltransferase [Rhizobium sp.]
MKLEVLEPGDRRWGELFAALPRSARDVFYAPGFAAMCQETLDAVHTVRCAAYSDDAGGILLYPFVLRRTGTLVDLPAANELADTISLYGRGGVVGEASAEGLATFHRELAAYMGSQHVFCSFDRLHPVIRNERLSPPDSSLRDVGGFIVVDLRPPVEAIEASFKSSVRKDIRKAGRNGVSCFAESNCDHLADFLDIYYQTMERNSASEFYYFPKEFFARLPEALPGMFSFIYAVSGDKIVSCELVLHCGDYSHSFLGGTRKEALPLAANPMLKFEICKEMKACGCQYFLLGGGQAPDDGIFNFKKAYAPGGVYPSLVGGTIWHADAYDALRQQMLAAGLPVAMNRFQFYDI